MTNTNYNNLRFEQEKSNSKIMNYVKALEFLINQSAINSEFNFLNEMLKNALSKILEYEAKISEHLLPQPEYDFVSLIRIFNLFVNFITTGNQTLREELIKAIKQIDSATLEYYTKKKSVFESIN